MICNSAALTYPAEYGNFGIMTFIVKQPGVEYQKDLDADTATIAKSMTSFDPDGNWKATELSCAWS